METSEANDGSASLNLVQDWSDLTWAMWSKLHTYKPFPKKQDNPDNQPPTSEDPASEIPKYMANFSTGFKPRLSVVFLQKMQDFLNYIVVQGSSSQETVGVVVRYLASRGHALDFVPARGYHETFQIGHWSVHLTLHNHDDALATKHIFLGHFKQSSEQLSVGKLPICYHDINSQADLAIKSLTQ